MRRHTFAHHTELSAGPPSIASSQSASDDSVVLDAAAETFVRARERAHRPFIPSGLTSSPAQSADHPSSTLSLPKTDYTMMAESANTACYAKSGIGKESLSELTGRPARVSINSTSREDAVAHASSESLRQRRSSFSPPPPQTVHQPLQSPHSPKRRPRPLPYPSPTAAMSGQLIREAAAAAVVGGSGADALPATPSAEAVVAQAGGVRDATEHRTTAGDTIHVTGDGASWRREEDAAGPHAPPRPFHRLATPTTATGPPSYVSVRTAAPSASTVRLDGRPTSQDGASGDYTPPPPAPLGSYDAGGGGPPTSLAFTTNASTSAGVRVSDDGVMNATHSGTSFSAFQPSATRARESTNSVDKSVESTVQRSTAATTFSPSRVMMSTAGTTAVTLLASHGGRSYRASSRRFSTSVGRNVDSHVYLNTNVMSHYEMVPNTTTTAPAPPAQQGAAAAEGGGPSSRPTPLSSSMASVAAAGRGEGGGVGVSDSRPPTAIINAVAGSDALGGDRDAPASFNQQQQQQGTAVRNAGGAAVAAVDLPISARYSTGIAAGAAQWGQPAVPNSHVVRVVSGLLRSPYPDELGATQLSESSLQSPPSTMDFTSVSPRPADGTEVSGGVSGAAGGSGAAAHAGAALVGIGRGPGGVSSLRSSNPISALLTGARTRPTTAVTGAATGGAGAQQQQHVGLSGTALGAQSTTYGCGVSHDGGAGVATNTNAAAATGTATAAASGGGWGGGNRGSRRPSPHGFWRGGREGMTAYKNTQHPFHRSRSTTDSVTSTGETMNSVSSGADANTPVPSPPTGARMPRLTSLNASSPASWASSSSPSHQQQQQQHSQSAPVKHSSFVTSAASTHDGQLSSSAENSIGRHPPLGPAFSSSYTLRPEGGGTNGTGGEAAAAPVAAAPRPPCQRVLSSLKDVFTAAASFRSIPNLHNVSVGAATSSPSSPLLHQRGQSGGVTAAAAAASTAAMRNRLAAAAAAAVPPPPPLPPTFALFGALERLSRFSELVQLHQEHTAVIDEFLSRLTMELHQTRHMGTCSASSLGGGALAGSEETQVDHEFLQWHRTLMYLFHNPTEMMKVGVEFFSDALNSWPLHMLYLTCCFHVTAAEHGFAALTTALRTGGIVCSGKGLFAALAVAMAEDGEMGLIRSTACMYRAAFYTGALMRKRHQLFDLESRVTTSSGFTLLVVNIPILTLRRLVARVNEGYDVFACIKGADRGSGVGDGAFSGRSCYSGGGAGPTGASPTSPVASSNPFQPHAVIEVSRVISSRSAVLCGHPLDLLRLDVVLARFADFNGVKIHKEYLPAGGPENSNFYNKRMPHDLLGFWQARGVSFSLASLRLPVYSPVNGDLWSDTPAATAASAMASDRTAFDALNAALSSLAAPPPGQSYRDGLFMYMVAEAATSANQDLTYSLRHMRDGNVLLDFSTHAIGIGRLIAWTNKSITVLAAPENRHESSAMPPPRRSPKDEAVLNTLGKLAVINEVLRAVSENLEQPPDALANPHVDLFTTFTELGLLEVMRVAGEGGEGDGTAAGGGANATVNGGPFDGSTMNQNFNARVTNSAPGSSRTLLAPARSFSDHLTGGAARGSGVSASGLVPASASVSRGDAPGSPFYTTPVPAAGRRMKSNVSALISAKSFANHPGLGGAASTTNNNTSVSAATYNATGTGNASNLSLSAPTAASPPAAAGLSIPSFDAGSGAAALNVSFAPTPPAAPLSTPPVAAVVSVNNAVNVNTAADFDLVGVPPPPPPSSGSLRSQPGAAGPPAQPPATTTTTGTPAAAVASPGASGTQQENLLVSVAQGALSIGSYPECRWSAALTAFSVEGGSLPGPITTATTPFGHHPVPSPTSVLIHRDQRRSGAASSSTGPLAPNGPAPSASTATTMTTNTGITSVNNTAVRLPSSHPDLTDKTSSHESDADYRAASLLRPPSSAHHPSSRLSNSPSPHIARFASDGDMSPPNHARSHTNGAHGGSELGRVATTMSAASEDAETGIASAALVAVAQGGAPSAAVEVVGSPPSSSTPLQLGVQLDSRGNTPTSPQTLWHTVSPVSRADSPAQPSPPGTATTAMIAGAGGAAANAQSFVAVADSAELMLGRLNARSQQQQQQQRVSPAASTAVSDHYPVSYHSMRNSSNNNTQTTLRSLRGIQYVVGAEEPDASVSGTSGSGGGCAVTSPLLPQQQQRGVGGGGVNGCGNGGGGGGVSGLGHTELSPLSLNEKDFVVRRNNEYAGIINVYQVSPLITYYEMQFNCVLCDGAVLFAALLQKASGIAFPPYTLLLCPSVFSLLELWDGFEYEELWKRSIGVVSASRIASPMSAGLL